MNLIEVEKFGVSGYVFADHECSFVPNYCFYGRTFDAKPYRGLTHLDLSHDTRVSIINQVHGAEVRSCEEAGMDGDSIIVKKNEIGGVLTADCTPVILVSQNQEIGAVLHCGWKSAFSGLVKNTIIKLQESGFDPREALALIGPAAQSCCYEVGKEFVNCLTEVEEKLELNVKPTNSSYLIKNEKYFASIPYLVEKQCISAGLLGKNIYRTTICTICNPSFFSHRRDAGQSGRQLAILSYKS